MRLSWPTIARSAAARIPRRNARSLGKVLSGGESVSHLNSDQSGLQYLWRCAVPRTSATAWPRCISKNSLLWGNEPVRVFAEWRAPASDHLRRQLMANSRLRKFESDPLLRSYSALASGSIHSDMRRPMMPMSQAQALKLIRSWSTSAILSTCSKSPSARVVSSFGKLPR